MPFELLAMNVQSKIFLKIIPGLFTPQVSLELIASMHGRTVDLVFMESSYYSLILKQDLLMTEVVAKN